MLLNYFFSYILKNENAVIHDRCLIYLRVEIDSNEICLLISGEKWLL